MNFENGPLALVPLARILSGLFPPLALSPSRAHGGENELYPVHVENTGSKESALITRVG